MSDDDWDRAAACVPTLADAPLVVDDTVYDDITDLDSVLDAGHHGVPWKLVVLDGAALFARRAAPEHLWAAHTRLAIDVKRLARRRDVPVVLTASLGRQILKRQHFDGARPQIGDVAVSAAYEAEADVIIGVSRPDQFDRESIRAGEADLIVYKNRYSPTFISTVVFQSHYSRFVDFAPTPDPTPEAKHQ